MNRALKTATIAWLVTAVYYFYQYTLRSAPAVMMPQLSDAFGAVKAWTGFMIATNEIASNRRVDFDTTVDAMALTAREMNAKYKETSEGGLAVSVVLC